MDYRFRSTSMLVNIMSAGLLLDILLTFAMWIPQLAFISGLSVIPIEITEWPSDYYKNLFLPHITLYLGLVILFSIWVYRANLNARALGGKDMRFSPGWAVAWFFIPVMNLF